MTPAVVGNPDTTAAVFNDLGRRAVVTTPPNGAAAGFDPPPPTGPPCRGGWVGSCQDIHPHHYRDLCHRAMLEDVPEEKLH